MKRIILMLTMVILALSPVYAQKNGPKKDRAAMRKEMREFKIKYLCQEMELTDEQREKFVPLYNQMSDERWKIFREIKAQEKRMKKAKKVGEADYESALKVTTNAKEKSAEIERQYDAQFSKFLSAKQLYKMKEAEAQFVEKMRKMRHKDKRK